MAAGPFFFLMVRDADDQTRFQVQPGAPRAGAAGGIFGGEGEI
jgi:hypothetical protein